MAGLLCAAGHDCAHVYELGLGGQPDEQIMALADRENRILISADTDFGKLLANAPVLAPSIILLRRADKASRLPRRGHPCQPRAGHGRPCRRRADRDQRHPRPHSPPPHETVRLRAVWHRAIRPRHLRVVVARYGRFEPTAHAESSAYSRRMAMPDAAYSCDALAAVPQSSMRDSVVPYADYWTFGRAEIANYSRSRDNIGRYRSADPPNARFRASKSPSVPGKFNCSRGSF
jgi:hypothetical protein